MKYPLLTICLLAYNCQHLIERTLKSILSQTYPNFEILISDNQSTDNTPKILKKYQEQNPKKIFLRKNISKIIPGKIYDGCYDNTNGCINSGLIRGEFVCFFHSDDIYHRDIAKKEIEFLTGNNDAGAVFVLPNIINQQDKIIGRKKLPKELMGKNIYNFEEIFKALLKYGNLFMSTSTFMTKKTILDKMGLFEWEDFATSADLHMWLKILENYKIGILNEYLINRRSESGGKRDTILRTDRADYFKVMDFFLKKSKINFEKKYLEQYQYQIHFNDTLRSMNFLILGNEKQAKDLISKPFRPEILAALLKNITVKRLQMFLLEIILFLGTRTGLAKPLGKLLRKISID